MKKRLGYLVSTFLILGLVFGTGFIHKASATVPGNNQLISQSSTGDWANNNSNIGVHSISGDGRYVVFISSATNLTPNDSNNASDIYVRDTETGTTTLVDVSNSGDQANASAYWPAISYSGQYVVFFSSATNLVSGVTIPSGSHLYIRDLTNQTTNIVDINSSGQVGSAYSAYTPAAVNADGRYVVFSTSSSALLGATTTYHQVVVKDMKTGNITALSKDANGNLAIYDNIDPSIDCDGHIVSFLSGTNLTTDTPWNFTHVYNTYNIYVSDVDWTTNQLTYTGMSPSSFHLTPTQTSCNGNIITGYGRKYNRLTTSSTSLLYASNYVVSTSDDGRYIAFLSKATNIDSASHPSTGRGPDYDVFVEDTETGVISLVSFTVAGNMSGLVNNLSISADGSTIAYAYPTPDSSNPSSELVSGVDTGKTDVYISKTGF